MEGNFFSLKILIKCNEAKSLAFAYVDLINFTHNQRIDRISNLSKYGPITLIHISDEEGNDAKTLYPILPNGTKIFRNFFYSDLLNRSSINVFPIGPRDEFLKSVNPKISSKRSFPWAFMGTLKNLH